MDCRKCYIEPTTDSIFYEVCDYIYCENCIEDIFTNFEIGTIIRYDCEICRESKGTKSCLCYCDDYDCKWYICDKCSEDKDYMKNIKSKFAKYKITKLT